MFIVICFAHCSYIPTSMVTPGLRPGSQHSDPISHSVTLSWYCANQSLPYPINAKRPPRLWQVSILWVTGLSWPGIELPNSHTGGLRYTDSSSHYYDEYDYDDFGDYDDQHQHHQHRLYVFKRRHIIIININSEWISICKYLKLHSPLILGFCHFVWDKYFKLIVIICFTFIWSNIYFKRLDFEIYWNANMSN